MSRFLSAVAVALLLLVGFLTAQGPVMIGPSDAIGFDYLDADFTTYAVQGFDVQYDAGGWTSIGVPTTRVTSGGITTYRIVPTLTGTHTIAFRACNTSGCSAGTSPFAYTFVSSVPTAPTNVRKVAR